MNYVDCFRALARQRTDQVVITSAGNSSQAWWEVTRDTEASFYLDASMGLSTMFASGLALAQPTLRIWAFMGDGEMGLGARTPSRVAVAAWKWGAYLGDEGMKNGIRVKTSSFARFHPNTLLTKSKAVGHYVNSIMASREARTAGYDEALLLDVDGYVSEASGENIFIVSDGVVKTTPLPTILAGITRHAILRILGDLGYAVREERFTRDEVYLADESFFTGTAAEVTPIRELDRRIIGSGSRGPITEKIQGAFFDIVHGRNPKYRSWLTPVETQNVAALRA